MMVTGTALVSVVYTFTMFSPANSGVNLNLASKSVVSTVVLSKVPLAAFALTVNSCGNPPSNAAIVPSVLIVCLKSTVMFTASPVKPVVSVGSTFMITQLSTVIPSLTLPTAPSLLPHQLLFARRVPLV